MPDPAPASRRRPPACLPSRAWRLRLRLTGGIGAVLVAGAGAWAVLVPPPNLPPNPVLETPAPDAARASEPLDPSLFAVALWIRPPEPPPPPAPAPAPQPPPPPPNLELVAILDASPGEYAAAIFDPAADELRILRPGDRVAGGTLVAVDADGVLIEVARRRHRINLVRLAPERSR